MAVSGAKPKPPGQAVTRHKPLHDWSEVENRPHVGGPKLPIRYVPDPETGKAIRVAWPKPTLAWWAVIKAMPHCVLWTPADWQYAIETAEAHARFIERATNGTELRIRQKALGTTLDARRDLRIRYIDPKPEAVDDPAAESAGVITLDDYR
jgi:hypothetical protein